MSEAVKKAVKKYQGKLRQLKLWLTPEEFLTFQELAQKKKLTKIALFRELLDKEL